MLCTPQASDPDVDESSELQYSLVKPTSVLDVEASTGQLYVLDASSVVDPLVTYEVKATDKYGLFTTTTVEVSRNQDQIEGFCMTFSNYQLRTEQQNRAVNEGKLTKLLTFAPYTGHSETKCK